jgi:RimJ/RimL family protein N-acetyltransferase
MKILETECLFLREMTINDAEKLYLLNLDVQVLKYTGDKPFDSVQNAKQFLENYDHYKKYKLGRWAVIHKNTNEFLGWCGLKYTPKLSEYDIGFRFYKKYWNNGYATESAKACISLGFDRYCITEIVGRAMTKNIGSIKVLEKIGMKYFKEFCFDGKNGVIYKIENKNRPTIIGEVH